MKIKILLKNTILLMSFLTIIHQAFLKDTHANNLGYDGGDGSINNPYIISTPEQLNYLRIMTNENSELNTKDKYFLLNNDIDLSNFDSDSNVDNGNWEPIGVDGNPFLGNFNGNGHSISNININTENLNDRGLFGNISEAEIKFLVLKDININGNDRVGGLVGYSNNSRIEKIYVNGYINGKYRVGGILGSQNIGITELCISNATVYNVGARTGGIVGSGWTATIRDCLSEASVQGDNSFVGGIIGYGASSSQIVNSLNIGPIKSNAQKGGITGYSTNSQVINSYWDIESSLTEVNIGAGVGLKTSQLLKNNAEVNLNNFDFINKWKVTNHYPSLVWWCTLEESIAENKVINAELIRTPENLSLARYFVNRLPESLKKNELQDRLNNIFNLESLIKKEILTSNLDIYIKSENILQMSLDTNSISFDDFSGIEDVEKTNAVNITINSSLPYQLNAYLPTEIQNSDKSKTMDKSILQLKESTESAYQAFSNTTDKIVLKDNCSSGNQLTHSIDIMLKGGIAHEKDVYKAVIRLEAEQK